jgi:tRNA modification GTPase
VKNQTDTIAAIATAPGEAGISVIRISGPDGLAIADRLFRCHGAPPSRRPAGSFVHGHIKADDASGATQDLDEVILLIFREPNSYTREDVVEIQTHGGRICADRIIRAILVAGARLAEPGEFTKRAFLNGRLDLIQAEAVADLIMARSDKAASAALAQLEGYLSCSLGGVYDDILTALADLEATLDFPDDEIPSSVLFNIGDRIRDIADKLKGLLATWHEGRILREGALVVISGKPNVGKSTLLNRLLGMERAIVSEEPGTTRDTIEEQLVLNGLPLRIVDTAGLRETSCTVENEGVKRANSLISKADLNLHLIDSYVAMDSEDVAMLKKLDAGKTVLLFNKIDLGMKIRPEDFPGFKCVSSCLLTGRGVDLLKKAIVEKLAGNETPHNVCISERHRGLIESALHELTKATHIMDEGKESMQVFVATHLRSALEATGKITGKTYSNDLLDNMFRRFCTGK